MAASHSFSAPPTPSAAAAPTQIEFGIRTAAGSVKSVHLVGSWDNYHTLLPLQIDHGHSSGSTAWRGIFQFDASTLFPGSRYWYYYIIDAQHALHDPSRPSTVEVTTGRTLNILDVPASSSQPATTASPVRSRSRDRSVRPQLARIAVGRPVSPAKIISPKPYRPQVQEWMTQFDAPADSTSDAATAASAAAPAPANRSLRLTIPSTPDHGYPLTPLSPPELSRPSSTESATTAISDSEVPGLSYTPVTPVTTSPLASTISASSQFVCLCEVYGVTAEGSRVKLSCGGRVCADQDDSASSCGSSDIVDSASNMSTQFNFPAGQPAQHRPHHLNQQNGQHYPNHHLYQQGQQYQHPTSFKQHHQTRFAVQDLSPHPGNATPTLTHLAAFDFSNKRPEAPSMGYMAPFQQYRLH